MENYPCSQPHPYKLFAFSWPYFKEDIRYLTALLGPFPTPSRFLTKTPEIIKYTTECAPFLSTYLLEFHSHSSSVTYIGWQKRRWVGAKSKKLCDELSWLSLMHKQCYLLSLFSMLLTALLGPYSLLIFNKNTRDFKIYHRVCALFKYVLATISLT